MQKKIEGLFEKHKSWNYELLTYLNMNALCSNPLTWDRIIQKCNKKGCLLYLFVTKTHILGCFHAEPCKISDKVTIQDSECGYFITDRN